MSLVLLRVHAFNVPAGSLPLTPVAAHEGAVVASNLRWRAVRGGILTGGWHTAHRLRPVPTLHIGGHLSHVIRCPLGRSPWSEVTLQDVEDLTAPEIREDSTIEPEREYTPLCQAAVFPSFPTLWSAAWIRNSSLGRRMVAGAYYRPRVPRRSEYKVSTPENDLAGG